MDPLQPWLDAKEVRRLAEGLLAAPPEVEEAAVDAAYGQVFEGFAGEGGAPDVTKLDLKPKDQLVATEPIAKAQTPVPVQPEKPKSIRPSPEAAVDSPFRVSSNQERCETDVIAIKARGKDDAAEVYQLPSSDSEVADKASSSTAVPNEPIRKLNAKGPFLSRIRQFSQVIREDLGAKAMFLIDVNGQILLDEVENPKLIQVARTLANASQRANRQSAGAAAVGNLHVKIGASSTLEVIPVDSRYGLLILGVVFPGPIGAVRVMQVADELHRTIEPTQ